MFVYWPHWISIEIGETPPVVARVRDIRAQRIAAQHTLLHLAGGQIETGRGRHHVTHRRPHRSVRWVATTSQLLLDASTPHEGEGHVDGSGPRARNRYSAAFELEESISLLFVRVASTRWLSNMRPELQPKSQWSHRTAQRLRFFFGNLFVAHWKRQQSSVSPNAGPVPST